MHKCKTCGREFDEFHYQRVFWSGDSIPVCPYCQTNVYEGEFEWKEKQTDKRFENMEAVGMKKMFVVVFYKNNDVIGSEIVFEEKPENIHSYLGHLAKMQKEKPNDHNIFEFDPVNRKFSLIE